MFTPIPHIINIDLSKIINTNKAIVIKRNDNASHLFKFNVFDNGVAYPLTGSTAKIYILKADRQTVFSNCTMDDAANGKISYLVETQAVSFAGLASTEVVIYGPTGEILTSVTFIFTVSTNIRNDSAIESTSEFSALTDALMVVTTIANKLDKTEFTTFKNATDATLASKANQLDVRLNATKLKLVDVDAEFVLAISGGTTISLESIPQDKSVTPIKTSFFLISKNLFNKVSPNLGNYIGWQDGLLVANVLYDASDYMEVGANAQCSFVESVGIKIAFYNASKVFISGLSVPPSPITTPPNTAYVRYSFDHIALNTQQFELGALKTTYEPYAPPSFDGTLVKEKSIPLSKLQNGMYDVTEIIVDMQPLSISFYIKGGVKQSNKYLKYSFKHETVAFDGTGTIAQSNLDGWRLYEVYVVTRTGQYTFTHDYAEGIVNIGEWECALHEKNMPDFMGGGMHGDEVMTFAHAEFDGVAKSLGSTYTFSCKSIKFVQKSKLYRVFTQTPVADHLKVYEITAEKGIKLYQEVKWLVALTLIDGSYLAMFPIKRTLYASPFTQITTKFYNDIDYIIKDVNTPEAVTASGAITRYAGVKKANIWGGVSGISAQLEVLQRPNLATELMGVSDSASYNKFYYTIVSADYLTTIGELMKMEVIYKLDIGI